MSGKRVDLKSSDGVLDLHVFTPESGVGPWPAVVLYMDAFGIRPELASMAQRLASNGYVVALPNLYYRTPFAPFAPNVVATEGPERERFKSMIASINHAMVMRDTGLVISWLDEQTSVKQGGLATLGYCMGGGYALSARGSVSRSRRCRGVVSWRVACDRQGGQSPSTGSADAGARLRWCGGDRRELPARAAGSTWPGAHRRGSAPHDRDLPEGQARLRHERSHRLRPRRRRVALATAGRSIERDAIRRGYSPPT